MMGECMTVPAALQELAAVLADPDFATDPGGLLRAWAAVVAGELDESARYALTDNRGGHEPPLGVRAAAPCGLMRTGHNGMSGAMSGNCVCLVTREERT